MTELDRSAQDSNLELNKPSPSTEDIDRCLLAITEASELANALYSKLSSAQLSIELFRRTAAYAQLDRVIHDSGKEETTTSAMSELLTVPELAKRLGVNRQTLWRLRKRGNFPEPVKAISPKLVRFLASDIERWMRGNRPR